MAQSMMSRANLNTLLELAATSGHIDLVKTLLAAGANAFEVLKEATKKGDTKVVSTLLTATKLQLASMPLPVARATS